MDEKKCCTVVNHYYGCCGGNSNRVPGDGNSYSTEETICGNWIDGKPIYRKVIIGKLAEENGSGLLFANVSNLKIDKVINLYGNMSHKNNSTQIVFPISYNEPNKLIAAVNMYYSNETGDISYHFLNCNGLYSGSEANVIIEYTKK
jgi:hypothetical protein